MARKPQIEGVPEVLRTLRRLEPEIRKEAPKRLKAAGAPLVQAARAEVPSSALMSGWKKGGRIGWDSAAIRRSITIRFRATARKPGEFTLLKLYSKSPALSVYDFADKARRRGRAKQRNNPNSSQAFIRNVKQAGGKPSRVMWRATERQLPDVQREVISILKDLERQAEQAMKRRR